MSFMITPKRGGKHFNEAAHGPDMAELAAREAEITQRVKRELAKNRALAEAQGRDAGHAEGFATGKAEGQAAMQSAAAALAAATAQLAEPLAIKQADLAALVTNLARALATHIIGCEIAGSPAPITALATQLLTQAAAERMPASHIWLRLNPTDHASLIGLAVPPETTLQPDPAIAPGGAVLEITSAAITHPTTIWDATIPTRLASLTAIP